jgi:hypothetical protein
MISTPRAVTDGKEGDLENWSSEEVQQFARGVND